MENNHIGRRIPFSQKPWFNYAVALCIAAAFYVILTNLSAFGTAVSYLWGVVNPLFTGIVIAYLIDPFTVFLKKDVFKWIKRGWLRGGLSVAVAFLVIIGVVVGLLLIIVPQVIVSFTGLLENLQTYQATAEFILKQFNIGIDLSFLANMQDNLVELVRKFIVDNRKIIMSQSAKIGNTFVRFGLGFILAIYLELDKDRLLVFVKTLLHLVIREDHYAVFAGIIRQCNKILLRYIIFDFLEGLIVGLINAAFMVIAGMPYVVLISVVVGATNLAPTFGPIAGAVIGSAILLLVDPVYVLVFLIFTVILQTVDGYVIKPKLYGNSLGVSSLLILIMLVVGGRMFGVVGVLLGIPAAAMIDFLYRDYVLPQLKVRAQRRSAFSSAEDAGTSPAGTDAHEQY